jgi:hypothetical protein
MPVIGDLSEEEAGPSAEAYRRLTARDTP